jgi:hypothetical protein
MDDELLKERGRLAALHTLAYAYEAQGDATAATCELISTVPGFP